MKGALEKNKRLIDWLIDWLCKDIILFIANNEAGFAHICIFLCTHILTKVNRSTCRYESDVEAVMLFCKD